MGHQYTAYLSFTNTITPTCTSFFFLWGKMRKGDKLLSTLFISYSREGFITFSIKSSREVSLVWQPQRPTRFLSAETLTFRGKKTDSKRSSRLCCTHIPAETLRTKDLFSLQVTLGSFYKQNSLVIIASNLHKNCKYGFTNQLLPSF